MFATVLCNPRAQTGNGPLLITLNPVFLVVYASVEIGPDYGQNRYGRYISRDPLNSTDMSLR